MQIVRSTSMPSFSAYRSGTDQAIPDGTYTECIFNSEEYDPFSAYDVANGRFNPQIPGIYHFDSSISVFSAAVDMVNAQIQLYKNGAIWKRGLVNVPANAVQGMSLNVSGDVSMNGSTDFISIYVYVDTTAGARTLQFGQNVSWFMSHFVRTL